MIAEGLSVLGDMYYDAALSGSLTDQRSGFTAWRNNALSDRNISDVFAFRTDRIERAENALDVVVRHQELRLAGIRIVTSTNVWEPIAPGADADFGSTLTALLEHHQNSAEVLKTSINVTNGLKNVTSRGFRGGGIAPYGFCRVMVNEATGDVIRKLETGERVKMRGCRVGLAVEDPEKIKLVVMLIEMYVHGSHGLRKLCQFLNKMGIKSPGAGRMWRSKNGTHGVSDGA